MSVFDHFRKEEMPFVERALEMLTQTERKQTMRLTDFLDPRQADIVQSLSSQVSGVRVHLWGGFHGAERVRALLCPDFVEPVEADYQLTIAQVQANQRFVRLSHRDVLGAFLAVGLKREKFGDILLAENVCQAVVASEVFAYVRTQVVQIHRIPVELVPVSPDQVIKPVKHFVEKSFTVSSPRIDAVVGEVCRLSRAKALEPIRAGKLKVNWKIIDNPSHPVKTGDVISLAGFGRFEVLDLSPPLRSGRLRMVVGVYD